MSDQDHIQDPGVVSTPAAAMGIEGASTVLGYLRQILELLRGQARSSSPQELSTPGTPSTGWMKELMAVYSNVLSPLAPLLHRVASRLSKQPAVTAGPRLLLVSHAPESVLDALNNLQNQSALFVTDATLERIVDAASQRGLGKELKSLLLQLHQVLDGDDLKDIPELLDRLKYAIRKHGHTAIGLTFEELGLLKEPENLKKLHLLLDALSDALGEHAVRKILRQHWLGIYSTSIGEKNRKNQIPQSLHDWLKTRFENAGIRLSASISVLGNASDVLILDHGNDSCYEFRRAGRYSPKNPSARRPPVPGRPIRVYGPRDGTRYKTNKGDVLLPVRVTDARQGLVAWSVDRLAVQEAIDSASPPGFLKAWETAEGRTLLALFMVDYRESDLDAYLEIGLGCFVAPRGDPLAVGFYALGDILVSTQSSRDAGRKIWGYSKEKSDLIRIAYGRDRAICGLHDLLLVTFPRGGENVSPSVPLFSYTLKGDGDPSGSPGMWHRTVIMRNGERELVQVGGARFSLATNPKLVKATRDTAARRLCENLQWFGIVNRQGQLERTPLYTVWTDRMKAEIGPPSILAELDDDEEEA